MKLNFADRLNWMKSPQMHPREELLARLIRSRKIICYVQRLLSRGLFGWPSNQTRQVGN